MIDLAMGWFEIAKIPTKQADDVVNILEFSWLTQYPWPTEIVMDRGKEFVAKVQSMIKDECGIVKKLITTRNPQANSIVERVHKTIHNMLRTTGIKEAADVPEYGWQGILSAVRRAVNSTVHTTLRATPTQLVFSRDAILNVNFQADWEYIKERKQKRILQNNKAENVTRKPHAYGVGDQVMIILDPNRKHGTEQQAGPYTATQVNNNGTVTISKAGPNGAVIERWNIRNLIPV